MRKIINSTYITLDGIVEDPHHWPSLGDSGKKVSYDIQMELLNACDTILMGRRTYEVFAPVWPTMAGDAMADCINAMRKQVASTTLRDPAWNNTEIISTEAIEQIRALKQQSGKNIVQYGLGEVSFALMEQGLMDEIRLWVHPIILGKDGSPKPHFLRCPRTRLHLTSSRALPNGIVILNYQCMYET